MWACGRLRHQHGSPGRVMSMDEVLVGSISHDLNAGDDFNIGAPAKVIRRVSRHLKVLCLGRG